MGMNPYDFHISKQFLTRKQQMSSDSLRISKLFISFMIGISYKAAFIADSQKKRNEIFPCPCFPRYGQPNERTSRWSWQMLPQELIQKKNHEFST